MNLADSRSTSSLNVTGKLFDRLRPAGVWPRAVLGEQMPSLVRFYISRELSTSPNRSTNAPQH